MRRLLLLMVLAGCASNMTDEVALTLAQTRGSTVRASEKMAEIAEHLPRTLEVANTGLATVTSSTSIAILDVGRLAASMDRTTASLGRLIEEARADARETREERKRIVTDVSAITSAAAAMMTRAEESSRAWQSQTRDLAEQETRAAHALAQLSESSARVSESVARLSTSVEPDVASMSRSVASILADVAKLTKRLDDTQEKATAWPVVVGAVAGLVVFLVALGIRAAFVAAVESAVRKRTDAR